MLGEIVVSKIGSESDILLRNLLQYYVHDMAVWFDIDTTADGSYSYDTSLVWENGYDVYLAKVGDSIAGFAIVGSAEEWLGDANAHDMHEFFVIRRFRRSGVGQRVAALLWNERPGEWLVRVLERNEPALEFWRTAIYGYSPQTYKEDGRVVTGRAWRFFRFVSSGA